VIAYLTRRVALLVPILLGVSLITFLMLHAAGGDIAQLKLGFRGTPEALARLRHELGLTDPLPVQYGRFLLGALHGDLGQSFATDAPVTDEILARLPATVELSVLAMLIAIAVGLPVGIVSATHHRSPLDYGATVGALLGVSVPTFWLGLVLIIVLAVGLHWLPVSGRIDPRMTAPPVVTHLLIVDSLLAGNWLVLQDAARHIVLPALTLAGWPAAIIARQSRAALLEAIGRDYVRTARAKGLGEQVVVIRHAFRNALLPVVTVIGLEFGTLLGGAVVTETVFAWPGVGHMVVDAIAARDYPLVQGAVLLFATMFVALNLLADLTYVLLDPRIRYA
jgi:ABC-type dipeptide/oligopeptide/nickel transport system permease component